MPRKRLQQPNYKLYNHPGGAWWIRWTEDGVTRRVSTRQVNKAAAQKWYDQWIAGRNAPRIPSQPTIGEILEFYLAARLPLVQSRETLQLSSNTIIRFVGNLEPRMLSPGYYTSVRLKSVGAGSVRREVGVLRAALALAKKFKLIDEVPYVEMPPRPGPRDRWLSRADVINLVNGAVSPHIRLFIIMAYHTAARTGAILDLTWDRVDFTKRRIDYNDPARQQSKKRRTTVPMNRSALAELQVAYQIRTCDHVIEYHCKPVHSIKTAFRRACLDAGITNCSPHVLRHTAASHMAMSGIPLREIARMLGDSEAVVEKVYAKYSPDYLKGAAEALDNVSIRNVKEEQSK